MKTIYQFIITLALLFVLFLSNVPAQDTTKSNLPESAKITPW